MAIATSVISCSTIQLFDLDTDPKRLIGEVLKYNEGLILDKYAAVIYSDRVSYKNGTKLTKYILKHKLGTITETETFINPAHKSKVKIWIWVIDWKSLNEWERKYG